MGLLLDNPPFGNIVDSQHWHPYSFLRRIVRPNLNVSIVYLLPLFLNQGPPRSKKAQESNCVLLKAVQNVVVVFQWLHTVVVKPSHGKAICGEHYRAGHIEPETAVLYG